MPRRVKGMCEYVFNVEASDGTDALQFHTERVSVDSQGREFSETTYDVEIHFRDPWEVMKRWIRDETLASVSTWFSQERYLCLGGKIDFSNPLYDEPFTGTTWCEVDASINIFLAFPGI